MLVMILFKIVTFSLFVYRVSSVDADTRRLTDSPELVKLLIHHNTSSDEHSDSHVTRCIGSIIGSRDILTAGHCLEEDDIVKVDVIIGEHLILKTNIWRERMRFFTVTPSDFIIHPNYTVTKKGNDIALIRLPKSLNFKLGSYMRPLEFHQPSAGNINWNKCRTEEWGETDKIDKEWYVRVLTDEQCQQIFRDNYDDDLMLCAGDRRANYKFMKICQYEAGAPLICWDEYENEYVQVGIASWGFGCGRRRYPYVYTRVFNYYKWIRENKYKDK